MNLNHSLIFFLFFLIGCTSPKPEQSLDRREKTQNTKLETSTDPNDYYENGNIRIERKQLENGDSLWIFKQEDGGCWEEDFYRDGEIYKKIVYNSDCTKSAEYELRNGNRHGQWISYHENGKIMEKGEFKEGIPMGIFQYFDEGEKLIRLENNIWRDSIEIPFFPFINALAEFKRLLNSKKDFKEEDDIKVAGSDDYHFPEITWGNSKLEFDMRENNDNIPCVSGEIKDPDLILFGKIKVGMPTLDAFKILNFTEGSETDQVNVYDLKNKMVYIFIIKDDRIDSIKFEGITTYY